MSKFAKTMKKIGKSLDDAANLVKKLDPSPIDVAVITGLQLAIKELSKHVDALHTIALTDVRE